jgi:hypothetical protein
MCAFALVVCVIFVHLGVEDISDYYGLYVIEQHVEPHSDESDGEAVTDEQNRLIFQCVANGDSSNGESTVGEDHSPPTQVEVLSPLVDNLVTR